MFSKLKSQYHQAIEVLIRPPRHEYSLSDLGPNLSSFGSCSYFRIDFIMPPESILHCSFYQIAPPIPRPCIVYLHCNSGSRCEAKSIVPILLPLGINVFCFDFSGCGKSEGDFVTLGYKEKNDIRVVIDYLRNNHLATTIGLWGRSMGAVASLNYAENDPELSVLILDSPFSSLDKLLLEIAIERASFPKFFAHFLVKIFKRGVKNKVDFNFEELDLTKKAKHIKIPSYFIFSFHDEIVKPKHSEELFQNLASFEKKMSCVRGMHNDPRPFSLLREVARFCADCLGKKDIVYKEKWIHGIYNDNTGANNRYLLLKNKVPSNEKGQSLKNSDHFLIGFNEGEEEDRESPGFDVSVSRNIGSLSMNRTKFLEDMFEKKGGGSKEDFLSTTYYR